MKYPVMALMIGLSVGLGIFVTPHIAHAALSEDYEPFLKEVDENQD